MQHYAKPTWLVCPICKHVLKVLEQLLCMLQVVLHPIGPQLLQVLRLLLLDPAVKWKYAGDAGSLASL